MFGNNLERMTTRNQEMRELVALRRKGNTATKVLVKGTTTDFLQLNMHTLISTDFLQ